MEKFVGCEFDGVVYKLPENSKYTCVDHNGFVFYCTRKVKVLSDDDAPFDDIMWSPKNRFPVQEKNPITGQIQPLRVELKKDWRDTLTKVRKFDVVLIRNSTPITQEENLPIVVNV